MLTCRATAVVSGTSDVTVTVDGQRYTYPHRCDLMTCSQNAVATHSKHRVVDARQVAQSTAPVSSTFEFALQE